MNDECPYKVDGKCYRRQNMKSCYCSKLGDFIHDIYNTNKYKQTNMIKPIGHTLLVKRHEPIKEEEGLILTSSKPKETENGRATVIDIGTAYSSESVVHGIDPKSLIGREILIPLTGEVAKMAMYPVEVGDNEFIIINENTVLAVY